MTARVRGRLRAGCWPVRESVFQENAQLVGTLALGPSECPEHSSTLLQSMFSVPTWPGACEGHLFVTPKRPLGNHKSFPG